MNKKNKDNVRIEPVSRNRLSDIIVSVLFLLIIFGFGIAILIIPDNEFSEDENRYLQKFPSYSSVSSFAKALANGTFGEDITEYYSDQFPLRNYFVGAKAVNEMLLMKGQNNNVVFGKDGYLLTRFDYSDKELLFSNLEAVNKKLTATGLDVYMIIPPRTQDILHSKLPDNFPKELSDELYSQLNEYMANLDLKYIDLRGLLKKADSEGEEIYYKTDHHWRSDGAELVYRTIAGSIGFEAFNDFEKKTVTESFYGTTWSAAGAKWISPDKIDIYTREDDSDYVTEHIKYNDITRLTGTSEDISKTFEGFYSDEALAQKDKYSYFIGGNPAFARVYKETDEKREKILLVKDSFANSLIPFIARHYDIDLVDPRYYQGSVKALTELSDYEFILCCINMDILTTQSIKLM